jgi:hypothetical protein
MLEIISGDCEVRLLVEQTLENSTRPSVLLHLLRLLLACGQLSY